MIFITVQSLIFVAILVVQLILAGITLNDRRQLHRQHNFPLSSQTNMVELLQKYSAIHEALNLKVNANISGPVERRGDTLWINRAHVYRAEAYPTLLAIYQIRSSNDHRQFLKLGKLVLGLMFVAEISLAALGTLVNPVFMWAAIITAVISLIISMYVEYQIKQLLEETLEIGTDLLDLDKVEQVKAIELLQRLRGDGFIMSYWPIRTTFRFLWPRIK